MLYLKLVANIPVCQFPCFSVSDVFPPIFPTQMAVAELRRDVLGDSLNENGKFN